VTFPEHVRLFEVTCTGRITPSLLIGAVQAGCAGVMVIGCAEERCRYGDGRERGSAAVSSARAVLSLLGFDPRMIVEAGADPRSFQEAVLSSTSRIERRSERREKTTGRGKRLAGPSRKRAARETQPARNRRK
jgi:coenzyme F420-reducing hydrogenase delta subunit